MRRPPAPDASESTALALRVRGDVEWHFDGPSPAMCDDLQMIVKMMGRVPYRETVEEMRRFTLARDLTTPDELWLCEHDGVFTQGIAGKAEHVLDAGDIPVVATDRGGQVTYHGPGQVVAYPLVDLRRLGIFVKEYVFRIESAVLKVLESYGVTGHRVAGAPGIYVNLAEPFGHSALVGAAADLQPPQGLGKIAALGVKVSNRGAYHGVALNVAMDLAPFRRINPCGYTGLEIVDLARLDVSTDWNEAAACLGARLKSQLSP